MTEHEIALREAEAAYRAAFAASETARATRNQAIRQALKAGVPQTVIAATTGLTRGRISQIAAHNVD